MVKIAPSLLSSDFANLATEIKKLQSAGADMLHFDVMDGCFVPNLTFGATIIKSVRNISSLPFDVHLMIENPDNKIEWFAPYADVLTFHYEATDKPLATLKRIKELGCKSAISIKPNTCVSVLHPLLDYLDMILIMTVEPGFGGQAFMPEQLQKIIDVKQMIAGRNIQIEVDGGININTAPLAISSGADILVAGTAVFQEGKYETNIKALRNIKGDV